MIIPIITSILVSKKKTIKKNKFHYPLSVDENIVKTHSYIIKQIIRVKCRKLIMVKDLIA